MASPFFEVHHSQPLDIVDGEPVDFEEIFGIKLSEHKRKSSDSRAHEKLIKKALRSKVYYNYLPQEVEVHCFEFSTRSSIPFGLSSLIERKVWILFTHIEEVLLENVAKPVDCAEIPTKLSLLATLTNRRISEYLGRFPPECNFENILQFLLKILDDAVITIVVAQIVADPFDIHRMVFKGIVKNLLKYIDDFGRKEIRRPSYLKHNKEMIRNLREPILTRLSKKLEREHNNSSQCTRDLLLC